MTKVRWYEHWEPGVDITLECTKEDAVKLQKLNLEKIKEVGRAPPDFFYESDQAAFDDFVCVNWANVVEE